MFELQSSLKQVESSSTRFKTSNNLTAFGYLLFGYFISLDSKPNETFIGHLYI